MITEYFCKGLLIGLIFGVPAGAIGALTIGRTLEKGFFAGFLTGMGSSAADLIYSCVGVFGITVVSDFLSARQNTLQVIGGMLILLFGFGILCCFWDSWRTQCKTGSHPDCRDLSRDTLLVAGSQWHYRTFPEQDHRENLSVAELRLSLSYDRVWHGYGGSGNCEIKQKRSIL